MKRIIRLTEGDLRRIVKRSANRILREFGSDGSDFDEPYGTSNMFQNIGMNGQHAESASDIDDFNPDDMGIYDGKESYEDDGMDFVDDDLDFYDGEGGSLSDGYYNEYDDDNQPDIIVPESRRRMSRIIKESIRKVLRESEIDGDKNFDDAGFVNSISKFCENPVDMNNYEPSDDDIYGAIGEFNPDEFDTDFSDLMSYNQQNESRKRMSRIIKESIRKVLKEASVYPGYDSTTTADIAGDGGGNIDGGNIITCYGSPNAIKGNLVGSILGPGVIYLGCNPNYSQMYGNVVPVKVDVSNFYRAKNSSEAIKLAGSAGFKDKYSGILYHSNMDGDVCAVFDRSCIIG
jgi:hypothetical protein